MNVTLFAKAILIFFICLIILTLLGIILGRMYNKFVVKKLSGTKRKILCILTIVIFLISSISVSLIIGVKSYINSVVDNYFVEIEKNIYENCPDNEYVTKGIDLNKIKNSIFQSVKQAISKDDEKTQIVNKVISDVKSMMPTPVALKIGDERIYHMLLNAAFNQSSLGVYADFIYSFADKNNVISVSSILNNAKIITKKKVGSGFNMAIILSIIPILIYVIAAYIYVSRVVKRSAED